MSKHPYIRSKKTLFIDLHINDIVYHERKIKDSLRSDKRTHKRMVVTYSQCQRGVVGPRQKKEKENGNVGVGG